MDNENYNNSTTQCSSTISSDSTPRSNVDPVEARDLEERDLDETKVPVFSAAKCSMVSHDEKIQMIDRSYRDYLNYCMTNNSNSICYNFIIKLHDQWYHSIPTGVFWATKPKEKLPNDSPYTLGEIQEAVMTENIPLLIQMRINTANLIKPHLYGFDVQFAVLHGLKNYLQYLLERNERRVNLLSALYLAIVYADIETLEILLINGANPRKFQNFAFTLAHYMDREEHRNLLVEYGCTPWIHPRFLFMFPGMMPYFYTKEDTKQVQENRRTTNFRIFKFRNNYRGSS